MVADQLVIDLEGLGVSTEIAQGVRVQGETAGRGGMGRELVDRCGGTTRPQQLDGLAQWINAHVFPER
ncbi:hypothetical protein DWB68_08515 [Galactobacter valiniphilus]|uniref:Uncharacterized protein n=1 Tax=Galactobacter valiniphilus TaxID=2676122 RepID=A0A399JB24_9MICC|nr:hypothetical protein DWB68_08515 [Galactobacter valiniphilus]